MIRKSRSIIFDTFGSPSNVLKIHSEPIKVEPSKLLVKFVASPINPSDLNQIQGTYPIRPSIPQAHAGNEGLAEVIEVGSSILDSHWKVGDRCIPSTPSLGTWRSIACFDPDSLIKLPKGVPTMAAATMSVNVFSAYRMLTDYARSIADCVVIQNASNSGVGRAVIQLASYWGIPTINIIRNRDGVEELKSELTGLGATHVVTEEELEKTETRAYFSQLYKDRLKVGLNCVGGKSAVNMARTLSNSANLITYGAMSREPFSVPASLLIFQDLVLRGFWMGKWKEERSVDNEEYVKMVEDVSRLYIDGILKEPNVQFTLLNSGLTDEELRQRFVDIVGASTLPFQNKKQIIQIE